MFFNKFRHYLATTVVLILTFLLFSQKTFAQSPLFQDDFNDGNSDGWIVIGSPGWNVSNNEYGISLSPGLSNSVPSDPLWNYSWTNISFEMDMRGNNGVDKNILVKFKDTSNFIEFHANDNGIILEKASSVGGAGILRSSSRILSNNITYHFRFEIKNNENIKVYLDDTLLFDVNETVPLLINWKVGLRAGTGASPITDVSFDNVVVTDLSPAIPTPTLTPTPTPQTPIVFLPGLGGSFNFKEMFLGQSDPNGWGMTPGANVYNNLVKIFAGKDYFYTFYYDWRKPVTENSQKLNDYIKNKVRPWNDKVNLVGHSLGGLVARACVQKTENNCFADKLITVGSPNSGAVDAYPALEGGEIWKTGPIKLGYELFLHFNQKPGETRRDTLERIAPVLKDLLPNFDYLTKNGINLPPSSLSFQNSLLPQLTDLTLLENKTNAIAGRNFSTVESIVLSDRSFIDKILGDWPDGKPINKTYTLEGDNSVLVKSASFINPNIQNWIYNQDHGGIISQNEPLQKILAILDQDLSIPTENSLDAENYLVFFVHSPLKLSLLNLPPDSYTDDEMIIIPNPENKNYQVKAEGTGNGYYQLSAGQIFGEKVLWSDYFGSAKTGETVNYTFAINPQNPKTEPLLDTNGSAAKFSLSSLIGQLREEVLKLNLEKNKQGLLLANLALIKPNYPQISFDILDLFRNLIALYEKGKIIKSENANYFRNRCSVLAKYLESIAFLSPKTIKKNIAQNRIADAEKIQKHIKPEKLSKNALLVYREAEEKLRNAEDNFTAGLFYQSSIFSLEAKNLFSESKIIK